MLMSNMKKSIKKTKVFLSPKKIQLLNNTNSSKSSGFNLFTSRNNNSKSSLINLFSSNSNNSSSFDNYSDYYSWIDNCLYTGIQTFAIASNIVSDESGNVYFADSYGNIHYYQYNGTNWFINDIGNGGTSQQARPECGISYSDGSLFFVSKYARSSISRFCKNNGEWVFQEYVVITSHILKI